MNVAGRLAHPTPGVGAGRSPRAASRGLGILAAAAAAVMMLAGAAVASAEVKTAIVDIVEVMGAYERTKDAQADLQVEQARLKTDSDAKLKNLEGLQLQRDGFKRGSEEWKRLDEKAVQAEIELRNWLQFEQRKIERRHQEILLDMYREVQKVVADVAKQKGLDLVFTKAFLSPPQISLDEAAGLEDLKARILAQRLIFPTPDQMTDITQDVLKKLNADYKASKRPEPPPAGLTPKG